MESKVAEAMSKKETLKARALTAETTKQLNESIVSMVSLQGMAQQSLLCCAMRDKQLQWCKVVAQMKGVLKLKGRSSLCRLAG